MNEQPPVVIVGTGLAGYSTAREFRKLDSATPLVLVTRDDGWFYSKPMISNALGRGQAPLDLPTGTAQKMSADLNATIRARATVQALDPAARTFEVDGETIAYRKLVLALGAEPVKLALSGDGTGHVHAVNDLDDYARFRTALEGRRRVAVLGAGLIGSEFANDLVAAGFDVTVVEPYAHPLGRLVPSAVGHAVQRALEAKGVRFHLGTTCERVDSAAGGVRLALANGAEVNADLVLSAVGLAPRTGLALHAGLACARGIVVDRHLCTSAEHVHALGDCMQVGDLVLPYVMPIMHAARALAQTLAGNPCRLRYPAMPVVVKTPAHPVVVAPPAAGASGEWQVQETDTGVRALFRHGEALLGFTLSGAHVSERAALARELPPVLD